MYKKSIIESENLNIRSEPDFYWGTFPVNFEGQNFGGGKFPPFPSSGGYAHDKAIPFTPNNKCYRIQIVNKSLGCRIYR